PRGVCVVGPVHRRGDAADGRAGGGAARVHAAGGRQRDHGTAGERRERRTRDQPGVGRRSGGRAALVPVERSGAAALESPAPHVAGGHPAQEAVVHAEGTGHQRGRARAVFPARCAYRPQFQQTQGCDDLRPGRRGAPADHRRRLGSHGIYPRRTRFVPHAGGWRHPGGQSHRSHAVRPHVFPHQPDAGRRHRQHAGAHRARQLQERPRDVDLLDARHGGPGPARVPPPAAVSQAQSRPTLITPAATVGEEQRRRSAEQRAAMYEVEIQKKYAIAAACIVFALVGAPAALRYYRGGVGLVIGLSVAVFTVYYVGLIGGENLGDRLIVGPFVSMWLPNLICAAVGALDRPSELTAAKASGISFHRVIRPLLAASVVAVLADVGLTELAPVTSSRRAELLGQKQIRSDQFRNNFVYRADGGWVYAI